MQEASSVTEATGLAQAFQEARSVAHHRGVVGDRRVKVAPCLRRARDSQAGQFTMTSLPCTLREPMRA